MSQDGRANGMTGEPRDPQVERAYGELPREQPPSHLDAAILAAARRAVGSGPQAVRAARRWATPVALAAVLVLSASLVALVGDELTHPERPAPTLSDAAGPERERAPQSAQAPAARPPAAAAPAPLEERAATGERSSGSAVGPSRDAASAPAAESGLRTERRQLTKPEPSSLSREVAAMVEALRSEPAEKWLAQIEALRLEGRRDAAAELRTVFERRFPEQAAQERRQSE